MDGLRAKHGGPLAAHRSWRLASAAVLLLCLGLSGCSRALNSPREVTSLFLDGIRQGSIQTVDTLVDWESVAVRADYVTSAYFGALDRQGKERVARTYQDLFSSRYLLPLGRATFRMEQVGEARGDADCWFEVTFAGQGEKNARGHEMAISLKYDKKSRKWKISDLGDLTRLAMLNGEFDPWNFYLQQPTQP